ncbi:MAG TPA: ADP-forming succinate--CoA ligase subunit beta [bacterium]|nr:ADP-forming succinate--CoA ligase subunit beta [bacterium]HPG84530.1 ADP-forming succinate--CoA ligase subunit beta [bacterium]HPM60651.1 ADP-forming succinate--CoA ligase subunit beta [bacterium]
MKIHEYQAKELLARYGIPVQRGAVAFKPREVRRLAEKMALKEIVLKAQVHAGGRGKAGGIKLLHSPAEAEYAAAKMFGMRLVTPQTGAEGKIVRRILVTEAAEISRELYAGIVLDRARRQLVFMVSQAGGVEIEKVAEESPEKIIKEYVDRAAGLQPFQARRMAFALGLTGPLFREGVRLLLALYEACIQCDASLLEINPLVVTPDQKLLALDVKLNIDDNALFRHPDIQEMRDTGEEDPLEVEASRSNLNYIKLDGNVGCMVNGAGLAMATMDIIKLAGAEPANFLDVGGGASAETVENGFRIILSDRNVRAVLINIFGGIVRCDRVARGVIEASKKIGVTIPVVVRLAGTNAEEAALLLQQSGMNFGVARDLAQAAELVVAALNKPN